MYGTSKLQWTVIFELLFCTNYVEHIYKINFIIMQILIIKLLINLIEKNKLKTR